jgi:Tfp pilus assembly protein PilV
METPMLTVLVALFLGVMGIIAMLEYRRRTELAQFEQLQQTLAAIHSSNEAQLVQVTEAVSQLHAEAERTTKAIQDLQASLEESIKF